MELKSNQVNLNNEQRIYVIPCGEGWSTYGFDYLAKKVTRHENELGLPNNKFEIGSMEMYNWYMELCEKSRQKWVETGKKSGVEIHHQLVHLVGKRVEVTQNGQKERFWVGKSTGWTPCLLRIKRSNSMGGDLISFDEKFDSIVVIR